MKIIEVTEMTPSLAERLIIVWEESVKATHLFLSENEVEEISKYIPQALQEIAHLIIAVNGSGCSVAFMGIEGEKKCSLSLPESGGRAWEGS